MPAEESEMTASQAPAGAFPDLPMQATGLQKLVGASEFSVSSTAWDKLAPDLEAAVREACRAEHMLCLADAQQQNAAALTQIRGRHPVTLEAAPRPVLDAARKACIELMAEIAVTSPLTRRIVESSAKGVSDMRRWLIPAADMARAMARV